MLGEMAAEGLDNAQLGLWIIDLLDSVNIPPLPIGLLHKMPIMVQTMVTAMQSFIKDFLSQLGIQEIEKQSFLRVREKCKILCHTYLNEGKRDQAVAYTYIVKANEKHLQYFTEGVYIMSSSLFTYREKLNLL